MQQIIEQLIVAEAELVSNPISGEVGAAATGVSVVAWLQGPAFQTPSAGRWVLQRQRG